MKVKAKKNVIYKSTVYKTGEELEIMDYDFPWLKPWLEDKAVEPLPTTDDDLVVTTTEGLPALDEETSRPPKKGKRNV